MSSRLRVWVGVLVAACLVGTGRADAQYFGQNKVQYDTFDFEVLETEHFDIYYYPSETDAAQQVARMAERWNVRLSRVLAHTLTGRQIVVLYASHPEFGQTNVIEGLIDEGTGGVTEGNRRRVVLPLAASLSETDHVLGHELVHAFQYDILGRNAGAIPLWFIEGMAEYLSLGPRHPLTAVWLRDAAREGTLPDIDDLENPRYFPYRFGHAFWAFVGGRWGDEAVGRILQAANALGATGAIEAVTETKKDPLSEAWHSEIRTLYGIEAPPAEQRERNAKAAPEAGLLLGKRKGGGALNVGAALSPDGTSIAFLSERNRLSIDLYVADAQTGAVRRQLTRTSVDPHFESLQFLASAGSWAPDNRQLAVAIVRRGRAAIAIFDTASGALTREIPFAPLGEIFQPAWSPDGQTIAFSAQVGGVTDLYLAEVASGRVRQLTQDLFADLHPAWSSDSKRLLFATDRFSSRIDALSFGDYELAVMDVATQTVQALPTGLSGNATNPEWSADGDHVYFVSDASGKPEIYRLDVADSSTAILTDTLTGVTGITAMSPALSVSTTGKAVYTVFREGGYDVMVLDTTTAPAVPAAAQGDLAQLRATPGTTGVVAAGLRTPAAGLPSETRFPTRPYSSKLSLLSVGQQIGVAGADQFGTYVSGGISTFFSDVLGRHLVTAAFDINGGVKDIAAQAGYLNRKRRWNWGVFGERVPLVSGTVNAGFATDNGQVIYIEQTDLFRQTSHQLGALVAYPFSRASRVEFSGSMQRLGFSRETRQVIFDAATGNLLDDEVTEQPSVPGLTLGDVSAAFVRDSTAFGPVGPVLGQRMRLEVSPTFGDLRMTNLMADYRQYAMPVRPVSFAGRLLHAGRYGRDAEDTRLTPLFLGYPTLVRGYDVNSFEAGECTFAADGSCQELDRLFGTRLLVFNGEMRVPIGGLFTGQLDYGPIPVELFGFLDAGVAWTAAERPSFAGGSRDWISSVGAGARVNLLGYVIGEFNFARPLQREGRGWRFVFNLRPAF